MTDIKLAYQGKVDGTVDAFEVNIKGERVMAIALEDGVVYVTWEDVKKFFSQTKEINDELG